MTTANTNATDQMNNVPEPDFSPSDTSDTIMGKVKGFFARSWEWLKSAPRRTYDSVMGFLSYAKDRPVFIAIFLLLVVAGLVTGMLMQVLVELAIFAMIFYFYFTIIS